MSSINAQSFLQSRYQTSQARFQSLEKDLRTSFILRNVFLGGQVKLEPVNDEPRDH